MSELYNIHSLCNHLKVSRSGYYKWIKRKGTLNRYQLNRKSLEVLVKNVHSKHKVYGYRNIAENIRNETGWMFSDWLCHKVCKSIKIRSQARKPKYARPGEEHILYSNIINNNWQTSKPFEKIVSDTTIIKNKYGNKDLTLYIDVFNNEVVSYETDNSKHGHSFKSHVLGLKKLLDLKEKRGYTHEETILHSDQGSIYASKAFANAHKDYNIKRSMSRVGTPTDNPIIEALNGWMKDELYIDYDIYNSPDVESDLARYLDYFNKERLASSLNYKTPVQYRTELGFS